MRARWIPLAVVCLDPEVIARQSCVAPPFHGDAFGTFRRSDLLPILFPDFGPFVSFLHPTKLYGGTVRNLIDDGNGLWLGEQPERS